MVLENLKFLNYVLPKNSVHKIRKQITKGKKRKDV